jgi:pimeloyl-ACP methyl ester carboxylesterase
LLIEPTFLVDGAEATTLPRLPGTYNIEYQSLQKSANRFSLLVPETAKETTKPGLGLILHYGGEPSRFYGRPLLDFLFGPALKALDLYLVAPESLGGKWDSPQNESFVMNLLANVMSHYTIDHERVVVGGYSLGALGTWHLIENYPDTFSAGIPIAGIPQVLPEKSPPIFTLACETDEIFPYKTFQQSIEQAKTSGLDIQFAASHARGHYDIGGFSTDLEAISDWLQLVWRGN